MCKCGDVEMWRLNKADLRCENSTANHQPSTINRQPPTFIRQLPTANRQL